MKTTNDYSRIFHLPSLRLLNGWSTGLVLVTTLFLNPARAADPDLERDQAPDDRPPREEVMIERRVVVRDRDERPGERFRNPERERQLDEMREHAGNLHRDGKHEEAERVEREIEEIASQRPDRPDRDRPRGPQRQGPRQDGAIVELQQRLNHLHVAMENLRAAGMPDLAMEVEHRAEETRRELEERARRGRPETTGPREELEQLRRELDEVRGQLEALRREVRPPRQR